MLPVTFALIGLYLRRKYGGSYIVSIWTSLIMH
jgi:hypothetical protein